MLFVAFSCSTQSRVINILNKNNYYPLPVPHISIKYLYGNNTIDNFYQLQQQYENRPARTRIIVTSKIILPDAILKKLQKISNYQHLGVRISSPSITITTAKGQSLLRTGVIGDSPPRIKPYYRQHHYPMHVMGLLPKWFELKRTDSVRYDFHYSYALLHKHSFYSDSISITVPVDYEIK